MSSIAKYTYATISYHIQQTNELTRAHKRSADGVIIKHFQKALITISSIITTYMW